MILQYGKQDNIDRSGIKSVRLKRKTKQRHNLRWEEKCNIPVRGIMEEKILQKSGVNGEKEKKNTKKKDTKGSNEIWT